jgi:hypothetical protein
MSLLTPQDSRGFQRAVGSQLCRTVALRQAIEGDAGRSADA